MKEDINMRVSEGLKRYLKDLAEEKQIKEVGKIQHEAWKAPKADRHNEGKLRWSLVDFDSLEEMVKVLEMGAAKYSPNNWKKGLNTTEIIDSMMRHLVAYLGGEDNDKESGLPHTGHIMCNAMFLAHMHKFKKEFDSRCCGNWDADGICTCHSIV